MIHMENILVYHHKPCKKGYQKSLDSKGENILSTYFQKQQRLATNDFKRIAMHQIFLIALDFFKELMMIMSILLL